MGQSNKATMKTNKETMIATNIALASRIKNGDKEAMGEFVLKNAKLLTTLCKTIAWQRFTTLDYEDVYNTAVIAFMECMQKLIDTGYEMDSSADFYKLYMDAQSFMKQTLFVDYYNGGIKMSYATQKRANKAGKKTSLESLDAIVSADDGDSDAYDFVSLADTPFESPEDAVIKKAEIKSLKDAFAQLSPEKQRILRYRYGIGMDDNAKLMTLKEISEETGWKMTTVFRNEHQAITEMAKAMAM